MNVLKIKIPKSVVSIAIFALILNILRVVIWGKLSFVYILWNIFLAFIPFVISFFVLRYFKEKRISKIVFRCHTFEILTRLFVSRVSANFKFW